ncbi:pericentrin isoform X3 [Lutzomyia longipalpis]|uniref:pericentrin isoform X3 n=1 Tax=Lutzomyia longipalpis TaxID=7200 RepID=UPI0024843DB8|nr:pericentrin isoform X3 [Lutzomyia longipalpis]
MSGRQEKIEAGKGKLAAYVRRKNRKKDSASSSSDHSGEEISHNSLEMSRSDSDAADGGREARSETKSEVHSEIPSGGIEEDIEEVLTGGSTSAEHGEEVVDLRRRQLFDLDAPGPSRFDVDDELSGGRIAQHFRPESEMDSLDAVLNELDSEKQEDDVILLNDQKVSLKDLRERQESQSAEEPAKSGQMSDDSVEEDKSVGEVLVTHDSIEVSVQEDPLDSLDGEHVENAQEEVERFREKVIEVVTSHRDAAGGKESPPKEAPKEEVQDVVVRPMERCLEYSKEVLEDISEESEHALESLESIEKLKVHTVNRTHENELRKTTSSNSFFSQPIPSTSPELRSLPTSQKDDAVTSSHDEEAMSIEARAKDIWEGGRELPISAIFSRRDSLKECPMSERDSASLVTNSTEYRTLQEEYLHRLQALDIQNVIAERDKMIESLTTSLQQSTEAREDLQSQSDRLVVEVNQLRKQLAETADLLQRSSRPRDLESQRLSEVSIDLVSETDEESERNFPVDRESQERKLDEVRDQANLAVPVSKQIEQFQKYLSADELRIFFMVQKKFDDFLAQEIEKARMRHEAEIKVLADRLDAEKKEKDVEMTQLRQYFERKCSELEKQYSEEIFSQHSHRDDTNSDLSDQDVLPVEPLPMKYKDELYSSPTHRKITPTSVSGSPRKTPESPEATLSTLRMHYERKMAKMTEIHEEKERLLREKLKRFEAKYAEDEFMTNDETNNERNEVAAIMAEYDRRLKEQVNLARQDILMELDKNIQALLSESSSADSHWPPELILLREKFTAQNKLEITQLQIKHEEEMSRVKSDFERQLNRKKKRNNAYDSNRDLEDIVTERDNLREISGTLRNLLVGLTKYCVVYEEDLNKSFVEQLANVGGTLLDETLQSTDGEDGQVGKRIKFAPDVGGILNLVEDPSLVKFISNARDNEEQATFNLDGFIDSLNTEVEYLLKLSEDLAKARQGVAGKDDSCEEEDGLKSSIKRNKITKTSSLVENLPNGEYRDASETHSLPIFGPIDALRAGEVNLQLHELRNRLVKSEEERKGLVAELAEVVSRHDSLLQELSSTKDHVAALEGRRETVSEGFGSSSSTSMHQTGRPILSYGELQEKAKQILSNTPNVATADNSSILVQLIEDFCREGDRHQEEKKRDRDDLQSQINAADKQLRATRQFLEEQAAEREVERDEFTREIEKLTGQLRERDKERSTHDRLVKEVESLENQLREMSMLLNECEEKKQRVEGELRLATEKILEHRECIADLEMQLEAKGAHERVTDETVKQLKILVATQTSAAESLKLEMEGLREEVDGKEQLEEQMRQLRAGQEQNATLEQLAAQLRDIEVALERKTRTLESLHAGIASESCSSPSEDVSIRGQVAVAMSEDVSPRSTASLLPVDEVQRILEKLAKHSRAEEAAIKRIHDLEMQISGVRANFAELQHERDALQERMSEQLVRISSLQSRLDEQRHRAEEIHRQGTSDLNIRVHDLQTEVASLRETLVSRDKQIVTLKGHLEQSREVIERQEVELAREPVDGKCIEKLEQELQERMQENQQLKEKIKNEMVNKLALPDLMETMLADKNEEIDHLRELLDEKEKQLAELLRNQEKFVKDCSVEEEEAAKLSGRTLSDVVSITDDEKPELARKTAEPFSFSIPKLFPESGQKRSLPDISTPRLRDDRMLPNSFHEFTLIDKEGASSPRHPAVPRQINFSHLDSANSAEPKAGETFKVPETPMKSTGDTTHLQVELVAKTKLYEATVAERDKLMRELDELRLRVGAMAALEEDLRRCQRDNEALLEKLAALEADVKEKTQEIAKLEEFRAKATKDAQGLPTIELLEQEVESLKLSLARREDQLTKLEKETINFARIEKTFEVEIESLRQELIERNLQHEKCKLELQEALANAEKLRGEVDKHRGQHRSENSSSPKPFSLEEIAAQVEQELNYSAQLDSNILRAIESDEINSDEDLEQHRRNVQELLRQSGSIEGEIRDLRMNLEAEAKRNDELLRQNAQIGQEVEKLRARCREVEALLEGEKKNSATVQQEDAQIIEALRVRLETALQNEMEMERMLEEARARTERISTVVQRSKSRESLQKSSPADSPRRSDAEAEHVARLECEIKLLTAQNERERDRVKDLQSALERERERFNREVADQRDHGAKLSSEIERIVRERDSLQCDLDVAREKLEHAEEQIESLEARILNLEDTEARRMARQGRERLDAVQTSLELQEMRVRLSAAEKERDQLVEQVALLREDIERGAKREVRLAEVLSREASLENNVPEQFLRKLQEMNALLAENSRENRQMAETLRQLGAEREALQKRLRDLETGVPGLPRDDLEDRANHLFGKYLRVESFRKALVHQKRYLMIVLASYQETEANALALIQSKQGVVSRKRRKSFRAIVFVVVAIERMRFIVRRWQSGKRMGAKAIFSGTHGLPRRSASAHTNIWSHIAADEQAVLSPRNPQRLLQAPTLVADYLRQHAGPN